MRKSQAIPLAASRTVKKMLNVPKEEIDRREVEYRKTKKAAKKRG